MTKIVYHTTPTSITKVVIPAHSTLSDSYPTLALALTVIPKNSQLTLCRCIAQDLGIIVADNQPLEQFFLDDNRQLSYTINLKV